MKDQNTGNPRGFGFVQFKEPTSVEVALMAGPHTLDKKTVSMLYTPENLFRFMNDIYYTKNMYIHVQCIDIVAHC